MLVEISACEGAEFRLRCICNPTPSTGTLRLTIPFTRFKPRRIGAQSLAAGIVVKELRVGVGGVSPFERRIDVVGAKLRKPVRGLRTIRSSVSDGFIHYVPVDELPFVMGHHRVDVFLQNGSGVRTGIISIGEPRRKSGLPHQVMSAHLHAIGLGIGDNLVTGTEIKPMCARLGGGELHGVFRDNQVELASHRLRVSGIGKMSGIDGSTHEKPAGSARSRRAEPVRLAT